MALPAGPKTRRTPLDLSKRPRELGAARVWFMRHVAGMKLYPWQARVIRQFGRARRPRVGYVQVPRKNGKTLLAAALALTELTLLPRRHVYAISDTERNLNSVLIRELREIINARAQLRDALNVFKWGIECPETGSFLEVRPGRFTSSQGINPHLVLFDEVHLQRAGDTWAGMQMAGAARADALLFGITTPGYDLTSLAHELYLQARSDEIASVIFEAAGDAAYSDRAQWRKANPLYKVLRDTLEHDYRTLPEHEFRRFRLGQWTASASAWLPYGAWDALERCEAPAEGERIVLGFDGSFSGDSTALVGATLAGDLFVVGVWENPGHKEWRVPRGEVSAAVRAAFNKWRVIELAADPPYWQRELEEWGAEYGRARVLEYPTNQAQRMGPATTAFYAGVLEGRIRHDGSATLARHLANATIKPTAQGDVIVKAHKHSPAKIDAAVAAIIALERARHHGTRSRAAIY